MKRIFVVSIIVAMALLAACGGGGSSTSSTSPTTTTTSTQMPGTPVSVTGGGTYWSITPAQFAGFKTKDFVLADTDTVYIGEIQGTDLFINSDKISQELDKFPADKSTKIVVYCAVGVKSQTVAATLVQAGYTRVMQLEGGLMAWQQQGYPIISKTRTLS